MLTEQEIQRLAGLSRLTLTEDELKRLPKEMEKMMELAGRITAFDYEDEGFDGMNPACNAFREDVAGESLPVAEILKNAANSDSSFFRVPRRRNY